MAKRRLVFIGECRSLTAIRKGWSWADGRLAAKPLFEALEAMKLDPANHEFYNLFHDPPASRRNLSGWVPTVNDATAVALRVEDRDLQAVAAILRRLLAYVDAHRGRDHL